MERDLKCNSVHFHNVIKVSNLEKDGWALPCWEVSFYGLNWIKKLSIDEIINFFQLG